MSSSLRNARALHFVFKIANRGANAHFFRNVLGMRVLRHEEFTKGCDAACNGPYDNRWSKTMVGYGPEDTHFVIELTYNYGVAEYRRGNEFGAIRIRSAAVLQRARALGWPMRPGQTSAVDGATVTELLSPDGYRFDVLDEPEAEGGADPVQSTTLRSTNVERTVAFWHGVLDAAVAKQTDDSVSFAYAAAAPQQRSFRLHFERIAEPIDRAEAYGRIAFAVPLAVQDRIDTALVGEASGAVLTPLITLETPGKADVRVIILADPDGHEICFVDEEGFTQLSVVEEGAGAALDKYVAKDPFQKK